MERGEASLSKEWHAADQMIDFLRHFADGCHHAKEEQQLFPALEQRGFSPQFGLIRERKVARPLYPQFGTEPNGFYIPPRWAPRDYLAQMFGPGVDHAIDQYSCPDRELLAVLQLFRAQRQILFRYEIEQGPKIAEIPVTLPSGEERVQELFNDTVIGYNKLDEEVVRITIQEPTFERPKEQHVNSI